MARLVDFGWRLSAERLVRPDVVEVDEPSIAVALLRSTRASRRQLELSQVAVHALVAAIVPRLSRARTNQSDAERHQPGGELRETAARPRANKGRAVVALDRARRAVLVEKLLQDAADQRTTSTWQERRRQHEAAVSVADCKRLALLPVAGPPPAFEVHGPQIVSTGNLDARATVNTPDAHRRRASLYFAEPAQDAHDCAAARSVRSKTALQHARDLVRAPARMLIAQRENRENDVLAGAARARVGPPALLDEAERTELPTTCARSAARRRSPRKAQRDCCLSAPLAPRTEVSHSWLAALSRASIFSIPSAMS
jgi:hypothetical protein